MRFKLSLEANVTTLVLRKQTRGRASWDRTRTTNNTVTRTYSCPHNNCTVNCGSVQVEERSDSRTAVENHEWAAVSAVSICGTVTDPPLLVEQPARFACSRSSTTLVRDYWIALSAHQKICSKGFFCASQIFFYRLKAFLLDRYRCTSLSNSNIKHNKKH